MTVKGIGARGKGGAALITAIVFVFFLTLFGLAFYRLGETDIDLFEYNTNLSKALYASEAGFDKVRWMIRESHNITEANPSQDPNPFSSTYVEANALAIANPTGGDFFPGEEDKAYFKVTEITAELLPPTDLPGSRVKVQALGSVDVDGDGESGLTFLGEGKFDPDPDDVNRTFEAYVGLPGTLGERVGGEGISAAASAFYASEVEVPLSSDPRSFTTTDGDSMIGFLYRGGPTNFGIWHQWGFIFSAPALTVFSGEIDEVELPRGIFDESGDYIDDDTDGIPDYFQDLDLRVYTGDPDFTPSNDPTAGAEGSSVIYFNGNITITGVDFGHLNDQGVIENCHWEGEGDPTARVDLTFIANGDITVDRIDCGNVGRLVLVAKNNIILKGDYDTKVNGIAIAFNDIYLNGQYCDDGILTHQTDFSRPVRYTAYFLGSMVAGNYIRLQNDGWTVIYDENVINGYMYSTAADSVSKPTLTYERAEAEDFNSSNNWRLTEPTPELAYTQGIYTDDEKTAMQGDSGDLGEDNLPELMRVYTDRDDWQPKDYPAIGETLRLYFPSGNFEDPDIPDSSPQNWDYYDTITFWMALDNFQRTSTDLTKTTRREAHYEITLRDSGGNTVPVPLDTLYPDSEWGTVKYHHTGDEYTNEIRDLTLTDPSGEVYSSWKRIKITPENIDPAIPFDFTSVEQFRIKYLDLELSWTVTGGTRRVQWWGTYFRYIFEDDTWRSIDKKDTQGDLYNDPPTPNDGYNYLYDDRDDPILFWFKWIEDPDSSTEIRMREEVLMPTLRIDRLELPGKPASNNYLQYGLPHSLRLEVTNWREL